MPITQPNRHVAAIDMGTNTFNLLIIRNNNQCVPELILSTKEGVALGMGGINENTISPEAWRRGMDCLTRFKAICDQYNCQSIKAIGTSSIRNADNGIDFVREVETKLLIPCQIINGDEEADMIYKGVCLTHHFEDKGLIMDIGGGSSEFIFADKDGVIKKNSFEIGVSRIYQQFEFSDPFSQLDIAKLFAYFETQTFGFFDEIQCDDFIGSSGSFETLYELLHDKLFPLGFETVELTRNEMEVMIDFIMRMTLKEREKHHRILPIRRKMLPIAAIKIKWVLNKINASRVIITPCSLKEGLAFDLLNNICNLEE